MHRIKLDLVFWCDIIVNEIQYGIHERKADVLVYGSRVRILVK